MAAVPRPLHPVTNAPGYMAAAGAIFAAATMIYNAYNHHGVIDVQVIVAAAAAIAALLTRQVVTPVSDPVDGCGNKLVPAPAATPGVPPGIVITPAAAPPPGS